MDYRRRPASVPAEAIYQENDQEWLLNYHKCPQVDFSQKAYAWDREGILLEEMTYEAEDGSAWSYQAFSPEGILWHEGVFRDCLRTRKVTYLVEEHRPSKRMFQFNYRPPQGAVKIVDTEFSATELTLACAYYDENDVLLGSDQQKELSTPYAWKLHQIGVAFNNMNFPLAYRYTLELEPLIKAERKQAREIYPHLQRVMERYVRNSPINKELVESFAILDQGDFNHELNDDILASGLKKLLEQLVVEGEIDQAYTYLLYLIEKHVVKRSAELSNPFTEEVLSILYLNGEVKDLNRFDRLYLRLLKRLELMGKRTAVSHQIMQSEEMKAYLDFLAKIPKYDRLEEVRAGGETYYQLVFEKDVLWEGDFHSDDINLYYPEVNRLSDLYPISDVRFLGDFTVTGQISDERAFHNEGNASVNYDIVGNVTADSFSCGDKNFHVQGDLNATRYACFSVSNDTSSAFSYSLEIHGKINAPLFFNFGSSKHKHTGGFCADCIYISDFTAVGRHINVHASDSLREDLRNRDLVFTNGVDIEKLVNAFGQGENIFHAGYDPSQSALAGLEKLEKMKACFTHAQHAEVIAIGASIGPEDYFSNTLVPFSRDYYLARTYLALGGSQNEKKADKLLTGMKKSCKEGLSDPPQWEMLLFLHDYYLKAEQAKNNPKKILEHMQAANLADGNHYQQKANLLWSLGKKKAALFPAYLAINHFGLDVNAEIQVSKEFQSYSKSCETPDKVPGGYKQTAPAALQKQPFADELYPEEEAIVWYNGDVYWNGDAELVEAGELVYPEDVHCNELVIFGDLYLTGTLTLHHVNLYVTGNVFVERLMQGDSKFWCLGNVICQGDLTILNDIGGAETIIYGNLDAPVIAVNADRLAVYGKVKKDAAVISLCNFLFDETDVTSYHTEKEINFQYLSEGEASLTEIEMIADPEIDLTKCFADGKLLKPFNTRE